MFSKLALVLAFVLPSQAFAVAHHEQVVVQKLRDPQTNAVNGFRVHAIVDPESYDHVRMHVGKMQLDPALGVVPKNSPRHRNIAAGIEPGYVRATILDKDAIPLRAGSPTLHELQEVKLDVHYGVMNDLKPGDKVDLYTTFSGGTAQVGYNHVFGMHAGPTIQNDTTHVHELPSDTSTHAEATETP